MSFWRAVGKYFTFRYWFAGWKVNEAADAVFTESPEGIAAGFDLEHNAIVKVVMQVEAALGKLGAALETDKAALKDLNDREEKIIARRDECARQYAAAKAAGDTARMSQLETMFETLDGEIQQIEGQQTELEEGIKNSEQDFTDTERVYLEQQAKLDALPRDKARAIAEYVRAKTRIDISQQIRGIRTTLDSGPLEAIRKKNRELTAQAKVAARLDGSQIERQMESLDEGARRATSRARLEEMAGALAQKNAEKTGEAAASETPASSERTRIQ